MKAPAANRVPSGNEPTPSKQQHASGGIGDQHGSDNATGPTEKPEQNQRGMRWLAGPRMRKCWQILVCGAGRLGCRRDATSCASGPSAGANPAKSLISFMPTGVQTLFASCPRRAIEPQRGGGSDHRKGRLGAGPPLQKIFSGDTRAKWETVSGRFGGYLIQGAGTQGACRAPAPTADERWGRCGW